MCCPGPCPIYFLKCLICPERYRVDLMSLGVVKNNPKLFFGRSDLGPEADCCPRLFSRKRMSFPDCRFPASVVVILGPEIYFNCWPDVNNLE